MAILANRVKTKNDLLELLKFTFLGLKRFFVIILICLCVYLLYFPVSYVSKAALEISGVFSSLNSFVSDIVAENAKWVYDRLSYFKNLESENIKLKLQIAELERRELDINAIVFENEELRKLLKVTKDLKNDYLTSRLVGVNITPFSSAGIVGSGAQDDVKVDNLVVNQDGLLGRVTEVSRDYSSVTFLSDPNSRVPVVTSISRNRGILAKQGDDMRLIYLLEDHSVEVGELIYTSGDGKIYPYGLLVGKVHIINDDGVFVKLSANFNNIEFVNILRQNYFDE